MIVEGTEAASVTAEQITQVAADVETFLRAHKIPRKDIARTIGYSPGVVTEFLSGKYAGNKGQVAIDLENWLVEEEQRRSRPQTTQFVWTNVAMEIKSTATYCLDFRKIGLVYGGQTSGLGKTTALRAVAQELGPRRCAMVTIDKVDANPTGLLRKICQGLGIHDGGSNHQRFRRAVDKLNGRSHLLIIDQIHNLRNAKQDKPFYHLTDLYDETNTAQLWAGTADLLVYLERQQAREADESLAQVRRRIFPCVDLMASAGGADGGGEPLVTVEQVREMFGKNKLRLTATAARFLCKLCNTDDSGAIGLCVQIVEYATMMAEMQGMTQIDVPLLEAAMRRGLTTARSTSILAQVQAEQPRVAAKAG